MAELIFPVKSGHRCYFCGEDIDCGELFLKIQKAYTDLDQSGLRKDEVQMHDGEMLYVCMCLNCAGDKLYDLVKGSSLPW